MKNKRNIKKQKIDRLPILLTVEDIASVLNVSKNSVYSLIYKESFKILRLGPRTIRVPKSIFINWVDSRELHF